MNMLKIQRGFTLIELIVVISILGILSAVAIPRFIGAETEARIAAINGLNGALQSAVVLARARARLEGLTGAGSITMDGQAVTVLAGGNPTGDAAGITAALQSLSGFSATYLAGVATYQPTSGGSATCQITYTATTAATVITSGGC